jgi:hypothetical protein
MAGKKLTTCYRPKAGKKAYKSTGLWRLPAYAKAGKAYKLLPPFGRLTILKSMVKLVEICLNNYLQIAYC